MTVIHEQRQMDWKREETPFKQFWEEKEMGKKRESDTENEDDDDDDIRCEIPRKCTYLFTQENTDTNEGKWQNLHTNKLFGILFSQWGTLTAVAVSTYTCILHFLQYTHPPILHNYELKQVESRTHETIKQTRQERK